LNCRPSAPLKADHLQRVIAMKHIHFRPLLGACLVLGAAQAHATLVQFQGFANGSQTVNFALSSPNVTTSGFTQAGGFTTLVDNTRTVTSYCVDLYEYLSFGTAYTNYNLVDGSLHAFRNTRADADIGKLFSAGHLVNTATTQAAFQIAVWELAFETDITYDVTSGAARFFGGSAADSGGSLSLASDWLGQLNSITNTSDVQVLESITQGNIQGHQDQVFVNRVPEPSSVTLAVAALLGLGFVTRRRQR
jgi:hypothetical protein